MPPVKLLVPPGKSHRSDVWAEVPGLPDDSLTGSVSDWLYPGYAMERWLDIYEHLLGHAIPPGAPLFPVLEEDGSCTARSFEPASLMTTIKSWARALDFPEDFLNRLTFHGFRSGGCSDAINAGKMPKEQIQKQGRWSGHTYEMYIHLAAAVVCRSLFDTVGAASLTPGERNLPRSATCVSTYAASLFGSQV